MPEPSQEAVEAMVRTHRANPGANVGTDNYMRMLLGVALPHIEADLRAKHEEEIERLKGELKKVASRYLGEVAELKRERELALDRADKAEAEVEKLREAAVLARAALRESGTGEQFRLKAFHAVAAALDQEDSP